MILPPGIDMDTPLRLKRAAEIAFPDGGMTVSGLRRERDAGRLETALIAGKEYCTLRAIQEMLARCQGLRKAPASTSGPKAARPTERSDRRPDGSSATATASCRLDAALMTAQALKDGLPIT